MGVHPPEGSLTASQTARYRAQCTMIFQIGEGDEFRDIDLVSTAGFLVGDVDEPFELRRYIGSESKFAKRIIPVNEFGMPRVYCEARSGLSAKA